VSGFFVPLDIRDCDNGQWVVLNEFDYDIGELGGTKIVVPKGFVTDFASTPRILWRVFPPWGPYRKAAVVHDWLYANQEFAKAVADAIFLEAMEVLKVGYATRYTVYWGVHAFGFLAWNAHTKAKREALVEGKSYPVLLAV
jgi:hypothetical protein